MNRLLLGLCILFSSEVQAEVRKLDLQLARLPYMIDPLYPDHKYWQYGLDLGFDVGWNAFFFENTVAAKTRSGRFRDVFWEYKIGFAIHENVDVLWHHKSQHAMDEYRDVYPVRDMYGIRIHFLDKDQKK